MNATTAPPAREIAENLKRKSFPVSGMSCAACASSVESILAQVEGVASATVNFATGMVQVQFHPELEEKGLQTALRAIGYDLILEEKPAWESREQLQKDHLKRIRTRAIGTSLLTLPVFVLGMFYMDWLPGRWISLVLATAILFGFGRDYFIHAFRQARHGRANMDSLVALSTGIAYLYSAAVTAFPALFSAQGLADHVYFEAATVIISFISIGKLMEEGAKFNTSTAIRRLIGLQPKTVMVLRNGMETMVPVETVGVGEVLQVRPGERIPLDGEVTQGHSYVDESMITGEPIPLSKTAGDKIFAGTINQKGGFRFVVEKAENETVLSKIIAHVQEALGSKPPVQKLADKIAGIFVPVVLGIALLTFVAWLVLGGEAGFSLGFSNAIAVLVIACPCALGLATPTATMVGIGKGAGKQVLIKNAESLEIGLKVNAMVLDKTGTITEGRPVVHFIAQKDGMDAHHAKAILHAIETRSEHPLAGAIASALAPSRDPELRIEELEILVGRGIRAVLNGTTYLAGNWGLMEENGLGLDISLAEASENGEGQGHTVVYFADEREVLLVLGIADAIKPGSRAAVRKFLDWGIEVYMLTGDNHAAAASIAKAAGIENFQADVLPAEKAAFVKQLQARGKTVAMIGDGINDSNALAQADLSIAMGKGSDIAMDVAQVTLMNSDLNGVATALKLSRKTVQTIRQNLFWAFIYNLIGIPIAAGLLYPLTGFLLNPMVAGAAMAFSSVSVVLNSLRLKYVKI